MKRTTTMSASTLRSNTPFTPIITPITVIPNKLIFSIFEEPPKKNSSIKNDKQYYYYSTESDPEYQYQPFYADFGPLSLLQVHKFLLHTKDLLSAIQVKTDENGVVQTNGRSLCYYCTNKPIAITNSVFLISSFNMLYNELTAEKAAEPFLNDQFIVKQMRPYRDASSLQSLYDLTVLSCLKGLHRAIYDPQTHWYDSETFDAEVWGRYEQVENGDMNWVIPGKLMAFASPYSTNVLQGGWRVCTPKDLLSVFKKFGITRIVRLNNRLYDENIFLKAGFNFTELFFEDGTIPPENILNKFLDIMDTMDVVALHCKAGLGRTFESFRYKDSFFLLFFNFPIFI